MRAVKLLPLLLAIPLALYGQAWLSPKGDGVVTLLYQNDIERLHAFGDGRTKDRGHTYLDGLYFDTDFSFTDKLAVRVSLPFIDGKYVGPYPHLLVRGQPSTEVTLDDGKFHGGFQDFRVNVRYALSQHALKIAPFFQFTRPTNDYPTLGHAAIGFNETEYRLGVNVGRRLNPILSKAFVQAQYAFGFSPVVAGNIAPKRSYGELQLGYLLNRRISFQGSSVLIYTHNGINFDYNLFPNNLTDEEYLNHDRIARGKLLDASGSMAYQLNRSTNLFFSVGHSFYGTNGHLRYVVSTVGFSKAFTTKMSAEKTSVLATLPEANKAMTCTCAKTK
ncbi:MAG TPA: hypothetical protein VGH38_09715 [Bryobacteraceae bacterium]|jgi:hypothetical protein